MLLEQHMDFVLSKISREKIYLTLRKIFFFYRLYFSEFSVYLYNNVDKPVFQPIFDFQGTPGVK